MRFFLTGFMGCGKSFRGQQIATQHHIPFIDLDTFIGQKTSRTIAELFAEEGETAFRQIEAACLREIIATHARFVMATGGGTPCFHDNMVLMNASGITIYLKAGTEFLLKNLETDSGHRPLIAPFTTDELSMFIQKKVIEREPYYTMAHHIVEAETANETIFDPIILNYV